MSVSSESIIELMCLAANADGEFKKIEDKIINAKISTYIKVFSLSDQNKLQTINKNLHKKFENGANLDKIIDQCDKNIPLNLKQTAYAYALEICVRDYQLHDYERDFLKKLANKFKISRSTHQALMKSINIRCNTNLDTTDIA